MNLVIGLSGTTQAGDPRAIRRPTALRGAAPGHQTTPGRTAPTKNPRQHVNLMHIHPTTSIEQLFYYKRIYQEDFRAPWAGAGETGCAVSHGRLSCLIPGARAEAHCIPFHCFFARVRGHFMALLPAQLSHPKKRRVIKQQGRI